MKGSRCVYILVTWLLTLLGTGAAAQAQCPTWDDNTAILPSGPS